MCKKLIRCILRYLADGLVHLPAVSQLRRVIGTNVMTLLCIEGLFVLQLYKGTTNG